MNRLQEKLDTDLQKVGYTDALLSMNSQDLLCKHSNG